MAKDPVLIIGAGLGGLALAQSLHRQQIPFRIFERDPQTNARAQGWAISLHAWLMNEMRSSMRDDESGLRALAPSAPLGLPSQGAIFALKDGGRKELFRFGEGTPQPFVRVDRGKLRKWLLQGIAVEWEKKFVKYEEDGSGVTVHFEDGSSARGIALIGADGINSRVRSQLLKGGGQPKRLPIGIIVGEVNADPEQYRRWLQPASSFSVALADNIRLFIGLKSLSDDLKSAHFYWMFGWADQDAAKEDFWTKNASSHELRDFVMQRIKGLDQDYIEPFLATSNDGILLPPLQMRDMTPPALPLGRVTLLGDAVHPMVPFRGEGGNMAMKDAMEITKCLATLGDGDVATALKTYEEEMTKRAGESVIRSRESTFPSEEMFKS